MQAQFGLQGAGSTGEVCDLELVLLIYSQGSLDYNTLGPKNEAWYIVGGFLACLDHIFQDNLLLYLS